MKLRFNTVKVSCSLETVNNDFRCALEVVIQLNHPRAVGDGAAGAARAAPLFMPYFRPLTP